MGSFHPPAGADDVHRSAAVGGPVSRGGRPLAPLGAAAGHRHLGDATPCRLTLGVTLLDLDPPELSAVNEAAGAQVEAAGHCGVFQPPTAAPPQPKAAKPRVESREFRVEKRRTSSHAATILGNSRSAARRGVAAARIRADRSADHGLRYTAAAPSSTSSTSSSSIRLDDGAVNVARLPRQRPLRQIHLDARPAANALTRISPAMKPPTWAA